MINHGKNHIFSFLRKVDIFNDAYEIVHYAYSDSENAYKEKDIKLAKSYLNKAYRYFVTKAQISTNTGLLYAKKGLIFSDLKQIKSYSKKASYSAMRAITHFSICNENE